MRKLNIVKLKKALLLKKASMINKSNFYFDDFGGEWVEDFTWVLNFGKDSTLWNKEKTRILSRIS